MTSKKHRKILLGTLLTSAAILGFGCAHPTGQWVKASGQVVDEVRPVTAFTALELGPGFNAEVLAGEQFAVTLRGDAAFLAHVRTRVEHGSLVVRLSDRVGVSPRSLLSVSVRMPQIDKLSVIGSKINITGLSGDTMALRVMSGSQVRAHGVRGKRLALTVGERSRVEIDGSVSELRAEVTGTSEVRARQLQAKSAKVAVAPGAKLEMENVGQGLARL